MAGNSGAANGLAPGVSPEEDMRAYDLLPHLTKMAIGKSEFPWSPAIVLAQFHKRGWPITDPDADEAMAIEIMDIDYQRQNPHTRDLTKRITLQ